jgi:cation diffusion facilitator CzcD-associated flavoprotein CzcO
MYNDSNNTGHADYTVAVIGSGFGGIATAIKLKQAGINSFVMIERASEPGGTWRDNTYPGCACDVPANAYSLSFDPNPDWKHKFAHADEIQAYLLRTVDKHGLGEHLRFDTEVTSAVFDDQRQQWALHLDNGQQITAQVVIAAVGGLVNPAPPDIEGLADFEGQLFHTARWNHDYDLSGKRIAVIGTGASAVQVVPAIAPSVEHMSVFQRTPAWVVPKGDLVVSKTTKQRFRRFPFVQKAVRWFTFCFSEAMGPMIVLDSPRLSGIAERASIKHLERCVSDPVLREKLTPHFQFGCKRMLISDDFWPCFERDNVDLVTDSITRITANGLVTRDADGNEQSHPVDALLLATGFETGLSSAPFPITGRAGRTLADTWKDGAVAYKGMAVSGFPNWFTIMGPNTGPGHTSVLVFTEAQIRYIVQAVRKIASGQARSFEVKQPVQDRYNERIQGRMKYTAWSSGCNSWYLGEDGKNRALFPGFASEYYLRTRRFKQSEYTSR